MFTRLLEKDARVLEWSVAGAGVLWIFLILFAFSMAAGAGG